MSEFLTPSLLITEYCDSLINKLDIYTENKIKKINEKGLTNIFKASRLDYKTVLRESFKETSEIETLNNPYESQYYDIDQGDISDTKIIDISQEEDYLNKMRQKAIDEIRKVRDENLQHYKANKEKFKVDRENLNLEELKSQLFANKYCFLISKTLFGESTEYKDINCHTELLLSLNLVITDFYLSESEIQFIRFKRIMFVLSKKPPVDKLTKLDQRFLLANQVRKYFKETFYGLFINGYEVKEVIEVRKKNLFLDIQHIEVKKDYYLNFSETDLSSFDMDLLSAIKSLSLDLGYAKISDLSAFANLEYLYFSGIKLCQRSFKNLHKLIDFKMVNCDLSQFDFDSLNSLTSLRSVFIETDNNYNTAIEPMTYKIDLNGLINLKSLHMGIHASKDQELKNNWEFELESDSYNQLNRLKLNKKTIDFSKQLDLPELKCLEISNVDLSQPISKQSFYGMNNLIEIKLICTNITNVDFLDTDRLENLELLNISSNKIQVLRKGAFSKQKKLTSLSLCMNLIEKLVPGVFEGLECLQNLDISANCFNIETIDTSLFDGLKCLKKIFLRDQEMRKKNLDYLKRDGLTVY